MTAIGIPCVINYATNAECDWPVTCCGWRQVETVTTSTKKLEIKCILVKACHKRKVEATNENDISCSKYHLQMRHKIATHNYRRELGHPKQLQERTSAHKSM